MLQTKRAKAACPFVREAVAAGRLGVHGWYFDIEDGELLCYSAARERFEPVVGGNADVTDI